MSWLERRNNYVNNIVGPRPQVGPVGANPMDGYYVSQAELDAEKAYDTRWGEEGMKWYNALSPTDRAAYDAEVNAHNSKITRAGKIVKPLALGTIAAAGLGAGLQAAGGLGNIFGSSAAPASSAASTGATEMAGLADIAGGLNPAYGTPAYEAAFAASPGVTAAASAPGLTGIDAAMADLAGSAGLTPASMGAAGGAAAGGSSLWNKLSGLLGGTGETGGNLLSSLLPGLAGIYTNYTQTKDLGNLTDSVLGLFGDNSAYEKALRQQLERRDAASGRRSQYGPREVELQAALAKLASNQTDSLANLYGAKNISRNNLLNSIGEVLGTKDQGPWSAVGGLLGSIFGD